MQMEVAESYKLLVAEDVKGQNCYGVGMCSPLILMAWEDSVFEDAGAVLGDTLLPRNTNLAGSQKVGEDQYWDEMEEIFAGLGIVCLHSLIRRELQEKETLRNIGCLKKTPNFCGESSSVMK